MSLQTSYFAKAFRLNKGHSSSCFSFLKPLQTANWLKAFRLSKSKQDLSHAKSKNHQ